MGTDLEDTIDELQRTIGYYLSCCNPENKDRVLKGLEDFKKILKEKNE